MGEEDVLDESRRIWVREDNVNKSLGEVRGKCNCSYSSHIIPMSVFYLRIKAYMEDSHMLSTATAGSSLMHLPPLIHAELEKSP